MSALGAALFATTFLSLGCAGQAPSASTASSSASETEARLNVSAAATLRHALATLVPKFEKANHVKLVVNYGASGMLMKQIEAGSPADVFLSAGAAQVDTLTAEGIVSAETTATFAGNDVVILVAKGNPKNINGPEDLAKATKLTTGDPAVAPHGTKAREYLTNVGLWDELLPKFVFSINAAQTDDYVARGEVDAGLAFASDSKGRSDIEVAYAVPSGRVTPVRYVAAPIKGSSRSAVARRFVTYLLSPEAQKDLVDAGFRAAPAR